jgi:DNA-binding MarR family transcriptional regulator
LLERRRSPADRRRHDVALTATGKRRLERIEKELAGVESEILAGLDFDQRVTFHALLQRATASAPGMCREVPPDDC